MKSLDNKTCCKDCKNGNEGKNVKCKAKLMIQAIENNRKTDKS